MVIASISVDDVKKKGVSLHPASSPRVELSSHLFLCVLTGNPRNTYVVQAEAESIFPKSFILLTYQLGAQRRVVAQATDSTSET